MNKLITVAIVIIFFSGCIGKSGDEIPSVFKTDNFRIGDKVTYELWGKMIIPKETGSLIYRSKGKADIEIKENSIEDGFGNGVDVVDFYMKIHEKPYNQTREIVEDLPVDVEKHVYRLIKGDIVGGIVKSYTLHHAFNREREIEINSYPLNDIVDFFLQKEFKDGMNGSFYYENWNFKWKANGYDKKLKALRIDVSDDSSKSFSIWIRNGYSFPYQIAFYYDDGTRINQYTYKIKSFKRGTGKEIYFGEVKYNSTRNLKFYEWKKFGVPENGKGSKLKMDIQTAMAQASSYAGLKKFLRENEGAYMVMAEYWEYGDEAGWNLHFGNKNLKEDYVLNVSNSGRNPIPYTEISPYLPFEEIPKDIENISNKLLSVADAEKIFEEKTNFWERNFSFKVSFIEEYYPDTLFDIWEGNGKEKEIGVGTYPRGACLIDGFHEIVRRYAFGYWLITEIPPFKPSEWKINGENGMVTYVYEEYL
ncbi:MAG TPA: hypothetical protein ENI33_00585 [Thermoplasmatales archaeon]|nr:hypothetical protein [Thermoplasmatales archaeon]